MFTNTVVNNMRIFRADDNVGGIMVSVHVQAGALRVVCGTANATTVSTLSANTLYYGRIRYLKGTGANAVASVEFSTSKTLPGSGNGFAQTTTGSSANNVLDVFMVVNDPTFGGGIAGVIYDDFSFSPSSIGDFP
jgi:hypothetical protein